MGRVLILTADLPYFPGKNGHDYFNLRHLALNHDVAVLAPCYDRFPAQGVKNLERFLTETYFWPRPTPKTPLFVSSTIHGRLNPILLKLPRHLHWWVLRQLLKLRKKPQDTFEKLTILANCAPQLINAIHHGQWNAMVLIQTNLEPWLKFLPSSGAKVFYFHDIRSDYFQRTLPLPGSTPIAPEEVKAIFQQEQRITQQVDLAAFVSELDQLRAHQMFQMNAISGVAPIPVDIDYYTPRPHDWVKDPRPIVLFTGHLLHPPNVDAVLFFLHEIWPGIVSKCPQAIFQVAGLSPSPLLASAIHSNPNCELHANVPDIRPYFWNADVYVIPMRFGGGIRQKLFEAWSMCVPVVCTPMAAEGTGAEHKKHCWLEDSPQSFAHQVATLLVSSGHDALVKAAQQQVSQTSSVPVAAPKFQALIEKAILTRKKHPFKILFDLRWMEIGKAGGMEQATYELVSAISQLDRHNAYRIFAPRATCSEWNFPHQFQSKCHHSDPISRQLETTYSFITNKLSESFGIHPILTPHMRSLAAYHSLDFDMVHSLCGYTHPDMSGFPGILTIHDLQHIHYPQFFSPADYEERERLYRESAQYAKHIICISEFTRQDVHCQYGIPLEKMSTIWNIPSRHVWLPLRLSVQKKLLAKMHVTPPFFFFPAHCWPHKNHKRLIEAFQLIIPELPAQTQLIMTGRPFPVDHPAAILLRDHNLSTHVKHLGYRSPLEIRALFQQCLALAFPSLFEGFGMPVAEAIIAGKPVLCSNVTSLPEIAGEAALTFNPTSVDEIASCLLDVLVKPQLQSTLTQAAIRRRRLFSARRCALETMSIYQRVHNEFYAP